MDLIKNWKLHLLALIVVIVAESIGMHRREFPAVSYSRRQEAR